MQRLLKRSRTRNDVYASKVKQETIRESIHIDRTQKRLIAKLPFLCDLSEKLKDNTKTATKRLENVVRKYGSNDNIKSMLQKSLKNFLVDDFDLISRQRKTLMLPARINVADFIQSFYEEGEEAKNVEGVEGVCKGLCSYFDAILGTQLLYKFERIQYSDIMKVLLPRLKSECTETKVLQEHPGVLMSKLYPPIHLLRLLTKLPNLLATANLDPQALSGLISTLILLVLLPSDYSTFV